MTEYATTIITPDIKRSQKFKLMAQAYVQAECSHATDLRVGAIIVRPEHDNRDRIISDGYNGTPPKADNRCEDALGNQLPNVIHAERNAFKKLDDANESAEGCWLFVTRSPCNLCKDLIVEAKISAVFYCEGHRDPAPLDFLRSKNIYLEQINKDEMGDHFETITNRLRQVKFNVECSCD